MLPEPNDTDRTDRVIAIRPGILSSPVGSAPDSGAGAPYEASAADDELEFRLLLLVDRERERVLLYRAALVILLMFGLLILREYMFLLL
jgi:hypothetical protein